MNNFFGTQFSQQDLQQRLAERRQNASARTASLAMGPPAATQQSDDTMDMSGMMPGGNTLDDIIMQNNNEMHRRQSIPPRYSQQEPNRRALMMDYGSGNGGMDGYQFGQESAAPGDSHVDMRRPPRNEMSMEGGYGDMASGMNMAGQPLEFSPSMQMQEPLNINTNSHYAGMSEDMMQNMMGYSPMGMEDISGESGNPMNMFSPTDYAPPYVNDGLPSMPGNFLVHSNVPDGGSARRASMVDEERNIDDLTTTMPSGPHQGLGNENPRRGLDQNMGSFTSPERKLSLEGPADEGSYSVPGPLLPSSAAQGEPHRLQLQPKSTNSFHGIYSSSGFDMLGALMKVATRKNPEIDIGKVDMSCAFVVCDISLYDCPIIYVSDIFERLTGYSKHEVKGQNCRFLQSPDGKIEAGTHREFTDNVSVHYIQQRIRDKKEAQRSLINYRKGGQPFMNLLTMIPITGEDDKELKYYVGFQVDLVAKPTSVEGRNASGMYTVDYSQGQLPKYIWQPPETSRPLDGGQTISRDDVSQALLSINNATDSDLNKRLWDKVLLENTDDVVHVLSLKGLFLYLSPSSRHVLEYDASELVGTALSSICHPSDIVPVTRELKDTTTGVPVNVVFRIRRKKSGYTWFESHGSLCVEQGKGRKCIILVGRERPVYALHRHDIEAAGGIGESEMWSKLSTSGMFLFVSSSSRTLLDRSPEDLIGTSIQALMRSESRIEFGRSLEKARTGKQITHKHEILNKRGLVLQAQTVLYPGDASEGQKPTFLVAQTRLLKSSSRSTTGAVGSQVGNSMGRIQSMHQLSGDSVAPNASPPGVDMMNHPKSPVSAVGIISQAGGSGLAIGNQDHALASEDNIFDELKTTRSTSWQFELRQMEKSNRLLAEELTVLMASRKKRKRRKGAGHAQRDCVNCHTRVTPEWRRGPSGRRDLCNSCGLRWAKQTGRVSTRTPSRAGDATKISPSQSSVSPVPKSPLQQEILRETKTPNLNTEQKGDVKGDGAAMPESLGGRSTMDSMPVHSPSQGFREGGKRKITNINESDEGIT